MQIAVADCEAIRREINLTADRLMQVRRHGSLEPEAIANVMLAYRHLEDASMRLDKAIQALGAGQVPAA